MYRYVFTVHSFSDDDLNILNLIKKIYMHFIQCIIGCKLAYTTFEINILPRYVLLLLCYQLVCNSIYSSMIFLISLHELQLITIYFIGIPNIIDYRVYSVVN